VQTALISVKPSIHALASHRDELAVDADGDIVSQLVRPRGEWTWLRLSHEGRHFGDRRIIETFHTSSSHRPGNPCCDHLVGCLRNKDFKVFCLWHRRDGEHPNPIASRYKWEERCEAGRRKIPDGREWCHVSRVPACAIVTQRKVNLSTTQSVPDHVIQRM